MQYDFIIEYSDLYEKTKTLYKEKTGEEYSAYNGSSIKDNVTEFMANITHAWSVQQLKQAWVYDEFMATVSEVRITTIRSVDIPWSLPKGSLTISLIAIFAIIRTF